MLQKAVKKSAGELVLKVRAKDKATWKAITLFYQVDPDRAGVTVAAP